MLQYLLCLMVNLFPLNQRFLSLLLYILFTLIRHRSCSSFSLDRLCFKLSVWILIAIHETIHSFDIVLILLLIRIIRKRLFLNLLIFWWLDYLLTDRGQVGVPGFLNWLSEFIRIFKFLVSILLIAWYICCISSLALRTVLLWLILWVSVFWIIVLILRRPLRLGL